MSKRVIVVGGGVAGMQAALSLHEQEGMVPVVIEKSGELGGKLLDWHVLFPTFTPVAEVLNPLRESIRKAGIEVRTGTEVESMDSEGVTLKGGERVKGDAIVVSSGFDVFDARLKEEYGYKIYRNVITSVDLERMFNEGGVTTHEGTAPKRIGFLHCVGSRDEKVGQHHCSKVCCITGVKQAIEIKKLFPMCDVYNFYMDIRMFGPGYEELYRDAQIQYGIHFIRGRISEASQTIDNRVQIKAEDTLLGRPLKMTLDMLVLVVGMKSAASNPSFARGAGLEVAPSGFMMPRNPFGGNVDSDVSNIFYAGTVTAPKNIGESLNEGRAAAQRVAEYFKG